MKVDSIQIYDKLGREVIFRSAEVTDAAALIEYLKITTGETPFLIREPDEVNITLEQEIDFIENKLHAEREVMLVATIDGKRMIQTVLDLAKDFGYEQAELEVLSDNVAAIELYKKLGFEKYGSFPRSVKYSNGTYADADGMMKKL